MNECSYNRVCENRAEMIKEIIYQLTGSCNFLDKWFILLVCTIEPHGNISTVNKLTCTLCFLTFLGGRSSFQGVCKNKWSDRLGGNEQSLLTYLLFPRNSTCLAGESLKVGEVPIASKLSSEAQKQHFIKVMKVKQQNVLWFCCSFLHKLLQILILMLADHWHILKCLNHLLLLAWT